MNSIEKRRRLFKASRYMTQGSSKHVSRPTSVEIVVPIEAFQMPLRNGHSLEIPGGNNVKRKWCSDSICDEEQKPISDGTLNEISDENPSLNGVRISEEQATPETIEAQALWNERGYPNIQWQELKNRLVGWNNEIMSLLNGSVPSHFRHHLKESCKGAKEPYLSPSDWFRTTVDSSTGYYGLRGWDLM